MWLNNNWGGPARFAPPPPLPFSRQAMSYQQGPLENVQWRTHCPPRFAQHHFRFQQQPPPVPPVIPISHTQQSLQRLTLREGQDMNSMSSPQIYEYGHQAAVPPLVEPRPRDGTLVNSGTTAESVQAQHKSPEHSTIEGQSLTSSGVMFSHYGQAISTATPVVQGESRNTSVVNDDILNERSPEINNDEEARLESIRIVLHQDNRIVKVPEQRETYRNVDNVFAERGECSTNTNLDNETENNNENKDIVCIPQSNRTETEMNVGLTQDNRVDPKLVIMQMIQNQVKFGVDVLVALTRSGERGLVKAISGTKVVTNESGQEINSHVAISTQTTHPEPEDAWIERMQTAVQKAPWAKQKSTESTTRWKMGSECTGICTTKSTAEVIVLDDDDKTVSSQARCLSSSGHNAVTNNMDDALKPVGHSTPSDHENESEGDAEFFAQNPGTNRYEDDYPNLISRDKVMVEHQWFRNGWPVVKRDHRPKYINTSLGYDYHDYHRECFRSPKRRRTSCSSKPRDRCTRSHTNTGNSERSRNYRTRDGQTRSPTRSTYYHTRDNQSRSPTRSRNYHTRERQSKSPRSRSYRTRYRQSRSSRQRTRSVSRCNSDGARETDDRRVSGMKTPHQIEVIDTHSDELRIRDKSRDERALSHEQTCDSDLEEGEIVDTDTEVKKRQNDGNVEEDINGPQKDGNDEEVSEAGEAEEDMDMEVTETSVDEDSDCIIIIHADDDDGDIL